MRRQAGLVMLAAILLVGGGYAQAASAEDFPETARWTVSIRTAGMYKDETFSFAHEPSGGTTCTFDSKSPPIPIGKQLGVLPEKEARRLADLLNRSELFTGMAKGDLTTNVTDLDYTSLEISVLDGNGQPPREATVQVTLNSSFDSGPRDELYRFFWEYQRKAEAGRN